MRGVGMAVAHYWSRVVWEPPESDSNFRGGSGFVKYVSMLRSELACEWWVGTRTRPDPEVEDIPVNV